MTAENKHKFFEAAAKEILQDKPDYTYNIILFQKHEFPIRVLIEKKGIKRGFALRDKTTAKEFVKRFASEIEEIEKRLKPGPNDL